MMVEMYMKDGIVFGKYSKDLILDMEMAQTLVAQRLKMQEGKICPLLVHMNGLKAESKQVRMYMATKGTEGLSMGAFVVEDITERCLIKFFLAIEKPNMLTKIFGNEKRAIKWIQSRQQLT